jgi:MAPEG family.
LRAHLNAIENLAVFAPLVLVGAIIDVSTNATALSARIFVVARLAHYVIYAAGIPVLRTLAFLVGACATLVIAASQLFTSN